MIAYGAVQKAIHGQPFASDLDLLDKCIKVLSYCALKDAMAGRFRDLLEGQLGGLQRHHMAECDVQNDHALAESVIPDIVFTFTPGSKLHTVAQSLLNLIHRPFSGLGDVSPQATLSNRAETTMGTHLEWQWELKGTDCVTNMAEPAEIFGSAAVASASTDRLMSQPLGVAWSTWTPPIRV